MPLYTTMLNNESKSIRVGTWFNNNLVIINEPENNFVLIVPQVLEEASLLTVSERAFIPGYSNIEGNSNAEGDGSIAQNKRTRLGRMIISLKQYINATIAELGLLLCQIQSLI